LVRPSKQMAADVVLAREIGGAMLNLLQLPRETKLHARIPEPWLYPLCPVLRYAHRLSSPAAGRPASRTGMPAGQSPRRRYPARIGPMPTGR
jgi:hypothetical protein